MKKIITAVVWLTACATAQAEFLTGNNLLSKMNGDGMDKAQAIGYVQGVFDTGQGVFHCTPNGQHITTGQIYDMAKYYLEASPEKRHYSADSLIVGMLTKAWPCPKKENRNTL